MYFVPSVFTATSVRTSAQDVYIGVIDKYNPDIFTVPLLPVNLTYSVFILAGLVIVPVKAPSPAALHVARLGDVPRI